MIKRPRIGIFKFTSCDGCQLSVLNLEEEILDLIEVFDIAYFREASDRPLKGPFFMAVVEGSITTDKQRKEIIEVREMTRYLITIGACATSGGLQALRNWSSLSAYKNYIYPSPDAISALSTSTPISEHVYVDYELWGCPINKDALSETLVSFLIGKRPTIPRYSLCMECKQKGIPCILVSKAEPCLGPITGAGCGAICMSFGRPCYGCFGPKEDANIESLLRHFETMGLNQKDCLLLLDKMNSYAYRKAHIEQGKS
ncbi:MAG: sulfhydrogenase subunit delta [Thermodesulfovibrionales bacterium]